MRFILSIYHLVLDPRLKFEYYKEMKCEQKYIDAAEKAFRDQYQSNYAPLPEVGQPEETEEEDEIIKHIYKRHRVEKRDELELYLAKSNVNFDNNMDILVWWKVCNRNFIFRFLKPY